MTVSLAAIAASAVSLSFLLDWLALPHAGASRPPEAIGLHLAALACIGALVLFITARPVFSTCAVFAVITLLALVSNAKFESLREPFVFTDLSLFSQLFEHPRLYLPFLSIGKVAALVIGAAIVVAGYIVEPALPSRPSVEAAIIFLVGALVSVVLAARLPLTLDAAVDQRRFGFVAVFVAYLLNGLRPATVERLHREASVSAFALGAPESGPDLIVIQSESFFDARKIGVPVAKHVYEHFDRACEGAFTHGQLTVPAWGANTMRTEFAMLTGLSQAQLGYARFYPYAFVRRQSASIASWVARAGYRTVALHPYHASFFGRRRAFPLLGFERFLDITHFDGARRAGPYIADDAVADAIIEQLDDASDVPIFIFSMTMENHGPLHLERVAPDESALLHGLGDAPVWHDLTAYLRHVANADRMIGKLVERLRDRPRPTVLCFYGDHVPALSRAYTTLGKTPMHSDYFVWRNYGDNLGGWQDLKVEDLGSALRHAIHSSGAVDTAVSASQMTIQK
ncbi:LTA synthase family protein [Burkholderia pyrrocinia]|uniref:LTA synthase family protein n=1 Tax=Burkholderia pyrrocinia TaxID=60550 RepID=UPI0038B688A4